MSKTDGSVLTAMRYSSAMDYIQCWAGTLGAAHAGSLVVDVIAHMWYTNHKSDEFIKNDLEGNNGVKSRKFTCPLVGKTGFSPPSGI